MHFFFQTKIKVCFFVPSFNQHRRIARVGEHNTTTTLDGEHQDIPVAHYEAHEGFSWKFKNNDIALVYLARDISFNGELKTDQHFCTLIRLYLFHLRF